MSETVLQGGPCYDAMPAGRELDELVAGKVMGWWLTEQQSAPSTGMITIGGRIPYPQTPPIITYNPTAAACAAGYDSSLSQRLIDRYWTDGTQGSWDDPQFALLPKLSALRNWSPSKRIGDAWIVANKFWWGKGGGVVIYKGDGYGAGELAYCDITLRDGRKFSGEVHGGDTDGLPDDCTSEHVVALAICRAALLATAAPR